VRVYVRVYVRVCEILSAVSHPPVGHHYVRLSYLFLSAQDGGPLCHNMKPTSNRN